MDIRFIEQEVPHSGRGIIIDPHKAKQKSKICPGVTPPDILLQGSGGDRRRGKKWEGRTDDVTDIGKGSEIEYLEFSTPYFIPIY